MPRLSFRSATPALVCMGLIAGMVATTGSALPAANTVDTTSTTSSVATAETEAISAPLSAITDNGSDTLADARAAVADAREVTVDIRTSGLEIASDSTIVPTSELSDFIVKLEALDVTPTLLIPALTSDADAAIASVREGTAALRGQLDAAIEKKKAEEAAAKAAAEAKKKAEEEAAAAAAAETSRSAAAPSVNVNVDPASAQGIARSMAAANYGWGDDQFACLVSLWNKESGWNAAAYNASSGAYGIPQALPGSKMASAGADWQTNPATQIAWGMGYIAGRYGNPCGAWGHSQSTGWY